MSFRLILLFLFIIFNKTSVVAQQNKQDTTAQRKFYSAGQFMHESFAFIGQPLSWKGNDWLKAGVITTAAIAIMPYDENISRSIKGDQRYYNSAAVVGGKAYGEGYVIGGVMAAYGIYGLAAHDTGAKKIAIELLQSGLYAGAVTEVLKVVVGRARPYMELGANTFQPFTFLNSGFQSMPSGHTTLAFALSTVLSRHANSTALKVLAFVPAGFTMFSRIYQSDHWLSDEIIGASVGYFTANWVVDLHEGKSSRIKVTSLYLPRITYFLDCASAQK